MRYKSTLHLAFAVPIAIMVIAIYGFHRNTRRASYLPYYDDKSDALCGPRALNKILEYYGVSSTIDELAVMSGYRKNNGTSMYGLHKAATTKGLNVKGITFGNSEQLTIPFLAHTKKNHFIAVLLKKGNIYVASDGIVTYEIALDEFTKKCTNEALIFQRRLPAFVEGPKLYFDYCLHDFGNVAPSRQLNHAFTYYNSGTQEVVINKVVTNCNCTASIISNKKVAPGAGGTIEVSFKSKGKQGGKEVHDVYVFSNDINTSITKLSLRATVKAGIFVWPSSLNLGDIQPNTRRTSNIIAYSNREFTITNVDAGPGIILGQVTYDTYNAKYWASFPIDITITDMKVETFIKIHFDAEPDLTIPIIGNVTSPYSVKPNTIWLTRDQRNKKLKGTASVQSKDKVIKKISFGNNLRLTASAQKVNDKCFDVFMESNSTDSILNDKLELRIFDGEKETTETVHVVGYNNEGI